MGSRALPWHSKAQSWIDGMSFHQNVVSTSCSAQESPLLGQDTDTLFVLPSGGEFLGIPPFPCPTIPLFTDYGEARPSLPLPGYFLARAGSCSWVGNRDISLLISPLFSSSTSLPGEYSYMKEKENPLGMFFPSSQPEP